MKVTRFRTKVPPLEPSQLHTARFSDQDRRGA